MVLRCPDGYLKDYASILEQKFAIKLSESQLSRFFTEKGITPKKVCTYTSIYSLILACEGSKGMRPNSEGELACQIILMESRPTCIY